MTTLQLIEQALGIFCVSGQVVELRALRHQPAKRVECESFSTFSMAAQHAAALDDAGWPEGIYFTPNPIKPDMAGRKGSCRKEDISARHWLLVDVDPVRPDKCSSTNAELMEAWAVIDACKAALEGAGLTGAVVGCSGNGWHLCYPIDLPNDDASQALVKAVLVGLGQHCDTAGAKVDVRCFDAVRIWKLYGTTARKGQHLPEEYPGPDGEVLPARPHRRAFLHSGTPWNRDTAAANNAGLVGLLERWRYADDQRKGRPTGDVVQRAREYIARVPVAISGQPAAPQEGNENHGHDQTFHVAAILVKDFALTEEQALQAIQEWNSRCLPPWTETELRHKLRSAAKKVGQVGRLLEQEQTSGKPVEDCQPVPITAADVATIDDLIAAGATIRWLWPGWIQLGVLTAIAAPAGTGKTRFCADLMRRIRHGLVWPDGQAITLPPESTVLWVVADNHHDEMVTLSISFGIKECVRINADRKEPYGGTTLDEVADIRALNARVAAIKPCMVIVDTVGGATDKNMTKQEDAKAFYGPLQTIARVHNTAVLCITHLNATGQFLGRRILERVRVALKMDVPDPQDERRRLIVHKSNSKKGPALGVTMTDYGNEYDTNPPTDPDESGPGGGGCGPSISAQCRKAMEWLGGYLKDGPKRVSNTRSEGEFLGHSSKTLYKAMKHLGVEEYESEGRKWWRLKPEQEQE